MGSSLAIERGLAAINIAFIIAIFLNELLKACVTCKKKKDSTVSRDKKWFDNNKPAVESPCHVFLHIVLLVICCALGVGFTIASKEAFREEATGVTGTTTNIDGSVNAKVTHPNSTDEWILWDPTDIAEPAAENDMFFITTKRVEIEQTLGKCIKSESSCVNNNDCRVEPLMSCRSGYCYRQAWCPPEDDATNQTHVHVKTVGLLDFRILIRSHMYVRLRDGTDNTFFNVKQSVKNGNTHCVNDKNHPKCPYFSMNKIARDSTGNDDENYKRLLDFGGVIAIRLKWNCEISDNDCIPTYSNGKLDTKNGMYDLKHGYSFTDATYDGQLNRTFSRSTGILFILQIDGSAYRVSWSKVAVAALASFAAIRSAKSVAELITTSILYCCPSCIECFKTATVEAGVESKK